MRIPIFFFMAVCSAWGATWTVCASGCTYSNLQTALNAVNRGDILELKAGEVFEGRFVLPAKQGSGYVTVRTSRWKELPPAGTRVTAADAVLMPKLQPPSASDAALTTGASEGYVASVDTSTDYIQFSGPHFLSNAEPIACWHDDGTIPINANQVYYARDLTTSGMRVAVTPNGPAVDLTTTPTATRFRCAIVRPVSHWRFTGIEVRKKPGQTTEYNLVEVGTSQEAARAGIPHHIEFDRMYIHGLDGENGPRICIYLNSGNFSLTDSRLEFCNKEGEEGKAIAGAQIPGPILIRNNYISAGAINVLFGGDYVRIIGLVNGDTGGMLIEGNHFTRPMSVKFTAGGGAAGDPSGACPEGTWYMNTTTGNWFLCSGGVWTAGPVCASGEYYRRNNVSQNCASGACWQCTTGGVFAPSTVYRGSNYYTKNLFEMKSVINLMVRGNVFENNWNNADQSGIAVWLISQVEQGNALGWARGENINFERNIIRNSSQGIRIASQGSQTFGFRNARIAVRDNLFYKIGATDYPSIDSRNSNPASFAGYCDDCIFDHNTLISNTTGGPGIEYDTKPLTRWRFANNIGYGNQYGMYGDGGSLAPYIQPGDTKHSILINNGDPGAPAFDMPGSPINGRYVPPSTTLFTDTANLNFRLLPASPFSASCTTGCEFKATDNKDLGADIDLVESAAAGATTGRLSRPEELRLRIDAGASFAIVRYQAPDAAACSLSLFADPGRSVLHADTATTGNRLDSRTGNISDGRRRDFVLGAVSLLTPGTNYFARLDCGTSRVPFSVRTLPAGGATRHELRLPQARTVQYANNPAFTGATSLAVATVHSIPVSPSSLVYMRVGSQPAAVVTGQ